MYHLLLSNVKTISMLEKQYNIDKATGIRRNLQKTKKLACNRQSHMDIMKEGGSAHVQIHLPTTFADCAKFLSCQSHSKGTQLTDKDNFGSSIPFIPARYLAKS